MTEPKPRTPAPELEVETVGGGTWKLADQRPDAFSMIVFYRGLHCPICKPYTRDLDRKVGALAERGVSVIMVSGDSRERAEQTKADWGIENLTVGYGQTVASMRQWGLFISRSIREGEPAEFGEPGVYLIKPDGSVYCAVINSMPFARPRFDDVLQAIDIVIEKNYPARGEA